MRRNRNQGSAPSYKVADLRDLYAGRDAAIATKHGKDLLLAGLFNATLGIQLRRADVDTDAYSTFTGMGVAPSMQIATATRKARAAFMEEPDVRIAIATEGTFVPMLATPGRFVNREVVVFIDLELRLLVVGEDRTISLNYEVLESNSTVEVMAFAQYLGFPSQGIVLRSSLTAPCDMQQDFDTEDALDCAASEMLGRNNIVYVETDLRAHRNPLRREAILRAGIDLTRRLLVACPACGTPGFGAQWEQPLASNELFTQAPHSKAIARCNACGHHVLLPALSN